MTKIASVVCLALALTAVVGCGGSSAPTPRPQVAKISLGETSEVKDGWVVVQKGQTNRDVGLTPVVVAQINGDGEFFQTRSAIMTGDVASLPVMSPVALKRMQIRYENWKDECGYVAVPIIR